MFNTAKPELVFIASLLREMAHLARYIQHEAVSLHLTKNDFSPVTAADFAIQAIAAHRLEETFPGSVLIAEERAQRLHEAENTAVLNAVTAFVNRVLPDAAPSQVCKWIDQGAGEPEGCFWVLDPIDGTKGYRRGGQYATALAMIDQGRVIYGGLACPNLGVNCAPECTGGGALAAAEKNGGAWCAPLDDPGASFIPMHTSHCSTPHAARLLRSVESAHTHVDHLNAIAQHLGIRENHVARMDSQAKYACLAAGQAEFIFRLLSADRPDYQECIWDHAAGALILEEAGGRVTDLNGAALDFTQGRTLAANKGMLASNGLLHEEGLNAVRTILGKKDGSPSHQKRCTR